MTFSEIQADVSSFLRITIGASTRVTTTQQNAWINQGYRVAQSKLANANVNYYQGETVEGDIVSGTGTIALPDGFMAMKRFEIQYADGEDKVRVKGIDINQIWQTLDPNSDPWSQDNPFYALWKDDLVIRPIPDASSSGWSTDAGSAYKLWFIERHADLSAAGDTPALPKDYHHLLAYFAVSNGFRRLGKHKEADKYMTLWLSGLRDMVSENTHKDKVKPLAFTVTRGPSNNHAIVNPYRKYKTI